MNDSLETRLRDLPEPIAPRDIMAGVMARIAREADPEPPVASDRRLSISILVAHLVLIAATAYAWLAAGATPDFTAPLIGRGRLTILPMEPGVALIIAAGLTVLLVSLFGAAREVRYTDRR